jgi:hypothetical protein
MATKDEICKRIGELMAEEEKAVVVERRCETCEWYSVGGATRYDGECRKLPPTVVCDDEGSVKTRFPEMLRDEWCGEYRRKR